MCRRHNVIAYGLKLRLAFQLAITLHTSKRIVSYSYSNYRQKPLMTRNNGALWKKRKKATSKKCGFLTSL